MRYGIIRQQGYLMFVAVLLIIVIGFLGMAVAFMIGNAANSTDAFQLSEQAFDLAMSGSEHATHLLLTPTLANRVNCSGLSINNTLNTGAYTASSTGPFYVSSPTTLNGAVTAVATTIPVVSTANYQASGRVMIDNEWINYAYTDATDFLGVTRGVDGSVATTHVSGTPVSQYQCHLTVQGGVPNLNAPINPGDPFAKNTIQNNVQLQDAWAVGNTASSKYIYFHWNQPTENTWNNASITGSSSLNSVFALSYADAWSSDAAGNMHHWNGSSWGTIAITPTVVLQGVFCSSANNCHVVGAAQNNQAYISDWNGVSWTRTTPTGTINKNNLLSVACDSGTNCWAVGDKAGASIFYHWTGAAPWTGITESLSGYTFNSVFCNSAADCWAVGANATFARLTSGTAWVNYATGLPAAPYNGIFCNNTSDCWAVGNVNGGKDLFVHWNGTAWSRDASNPTPAVNLNEVSCANSNDCWAVGASSTLVHWDGSSWATFTTSGLPSTTLNSIAMIGPGSKPLSGWMQNF